MITSGFSIPLSPTDRPSKQTQKKEELNNVRNPVDLAHIYRTSLSNTQKKYTLFLTAHFSEIDHILDPKSVSTDTGKLKQHPTSYLATMN